MKCPKCVVEGKKSYVFEDGGWTTLVYCAPYYDEEGEYHVHDMNTSTWNFHCSEGHSWAESSGHQCPNPKCDWGKGDEVVYVLHFQADKDDATV